MRRAIFTFCLALCIVFPQGARGEGATREPTTPTTEQVDEAIVKIKAYLYRAQDRDGGWSAPQSEVGPQKGGITALVVLALLTSGESPQDERLARAIDRLTKTQMTGTYAVSLRAQAMAQLPDTYLPQLEKDTQWLLAAADPFSRFRYEADPLGDNNHSTTHYGQLGLWDAAKRGVQVPPDFWAQSIRYLSRAQRPDGGWGYWTDSEPYGSMTAAGVTMLLIAQQQSQKLLPKPDEKIQRHIDAGMNWLDKHFDGPKNPGHKGWMLYYLAAVERVGLASGRKRLNDQEWFRVGARAILENLAPETDKVRGGSIDGDVVDTAFALSFLGRGNLPVWATKLQLTTSAWNNRPNDLAGLTTFLAESHEAFINWQTLSIDRPPEEWLDTPVLYLASDEAIKLTDAQKASLKRYLELGGLLLANPDNGSERFVQSIAALCKELFPDYPLKKLPADHPLFSAIHKVPGGAGQVVLGVHNGARDLVLMPDRDWGFLFQSRGNPESAPWRLATNFWALATERNQLQKRLDEKWIPRDYKLPRAAATVTLARMSANKWSAPVEPLSWELTGHSIFNRARIEVTCAQGDLEKIAAAPTTLVHLSGVHAVTLSPKEIAAIKAYIDGGGILLVETVGGMGDFATSAEDQLARAFNLPSVPLTSDDAMLTGTDLENAFDNRQVYFRRFAATKMAGGRKPRLMAIRVNDRPAIVISREDLSLGAMGLTRWGIMGYQPDSARRILTNVLLSGKLSDVK